jgi:FAD/FMN-containing dehydrogenase
LSLTPTATLGPTTSPTATARPPADWAALRASLRGTLYLPSTAGYDDVRTTYNTRFDAIRPQAVARCAEVQDVQACVRFARDNGIRIALRSGGHSYAGWSTGTGLVVDVGPLSGITVADASVTVGAGAKLIDVYDAVSSSGRGIAAGSCPTVGIAGLALGGGVGVLSRAWGLTCDQLIAADVVTADGFVRRCSASAEPDLFWALRGGGGGNFGVVTSLTFGTRAVGDLALAFLTWPWADAHAVVAGWQTWMRAAPDALWSTVHLEGGTGGRSVSIHAVYPAPAADIAVQLSALTAAIGRAPDYRESGARSYRDVMLLEAGCLGRPVSACHLRGSTTAGELGRETFAAKSIVAGGALSDSAISSLVDGVAGASAGGAAVLIDSLGGAVARVAQDATAFPHRGAFAILQLYASWPAGQSSDASIAWLRATHTAARALIGTAAYVNYIDADLTDWAEAYYGSNYARLRDVKRRYDPDGVFDFPQAIAPA